MLQIAHKQPLYNGYIVCNGYMGLIVCNGLTGLTGLTGLIVC